MASQNHEVRWRLSCGRRYKQRLCGDGWRVELRWQFDATTEATSDVVQATPAAPTQVLLRAQSQPRRQGPQTTLTENWTRQTHPSGCLRINFLSEMWHLNTRNVATANRSRVSCAYKVTEMTFKGHSRSSEMPRLDRVHHLYTLTMAVSCIVSHIYLSKIIPDLYSAPL